MRNPKFSVLAFVLRAPYIKQDTSEHKEHLNLRTDGSLRKISMSQHFAYLNHNIPKSLNLTLFFSKQGPALQLFHHNHVLDDLPKTNPSATVSIISERCCARLCEGNTVLSISLFSGRSWIPSMPSFFCLAHTDPGLPYVAIHCHASPSSF